MATIGSGSDKLSNHRPGHDHEDLVNASCRACAASRQGKGGSGEQDAPTGNVGGTSTAREVAREQDMQWNRGPAKFPFSAERLFDPSVGMFGGTGGVGPPLPPHPFEDGVDMSLGDRVKLTGPDGDTWTAKWDDPREPVLEAAENWIDNGDIDVSLFCDAVEAEAFRRAEVAEIVRPWPDKVLRVAYVMWEQDEFAEIREKCEKQAERMDER